jgi:hypothetical protein
MIVANNSDQNGGEKIFGERREDEKVFGKLNQCRFMHMDYS